MGNFKKFDKGRDNRGGFGGGNFGSGRKFGGRDDGPRQMFPATCSKCGQQCEIPFKPTGDRPVFCRDCFKSQGGPNPRFAPQSFGGGGMNNNSGGAANSNTGGAVFKAQLDSLNVKLDRILALLSTTKVPEAAPTDWLEEKNNKKVASKIKIIAKKSKTKKK